MGLTDRYLVVEGLFVIAPSPQGPLGAPDFAIISSFYTSSSQFVWGLAKKLLERGINCGDAKIMA